MKNKQYRIIKSSGNLDTYSEYDLIESPAITSLKNVENRELICVGAWVKYLTTDSNGQEITCISVQDANTGDVFSGQSATFREAFEDITDRLSDMDEVPELFFIEVLHRQSKAGRDYLICALVSPDRALNRMGHGSTYVPMTEPQK
jgi:hypothetical protein|nr:MAG TPA: hypothetical protein [Caudoviricetes sp.]